MKKIFLYTFLSVLILGSMFTAILYSEGVFDTYDSVYANDKKFEPVMKCEAGKCGGGKCDTGK